MTAIPEQSTLIGAWDARDRPPGWTDGHTRQMATWMQAHVPVSPNDAYRVEFYVFDGPFAVVYSFQLDGDGRKYADPETCDLATAPPVLVPLSVLPPPEILAV